MSMISNQTDKVKKVALLNTRLNLTGRPLSLSLTYASNSSLGTGTFKVGIADRKEDKNTFQQFTKLYFWQPNQSNIYNPQEYRRG
jgi:hypothetical protein